VRDPYQKRRKDLYGKVYAMTKRYLPSQMQDYEEAVQGALPAFENDWQQFVCKSLGAIRWIRQFRDKHANEMKTSFAEAAWLRSQEFERDVKNYSL